MDHKLDHKIIVTIDREFGSGGHEVARRLAERLGVPLYDEEIIARAAAETGYHEAYIKSNDEKAPELTISGMFGAFDSFQNSPFSKIQEGEFKIIRDIAAEDTGCVIVGRAADYILRNEDHVSIFLFAPLEDRIQRKLKLAKMNETDEPTDEASMEKLVKQTDKQRRRYYEFYTDNKWGGREPYDLLINTSRSGVNGAVEIIEAYIMNSHGQDILSDM